MAKNHLGIGFILIIFGIGWVTPFILLAIFFRSAITLTLESGFMFNLMIIGSVIILIGIGILIYEHFIKKK